MGAHSPTPLYLLLFLSGTCAELQVSVVSPQTVALGSDPLLECTFTVDESPMDLQYLVVSWNFKEKELLKFENGQKALGSRGSINETEILNGNASLVLSKVAIEDEGTYKCVVIYSPWMQEKDINVHLQAPPEITIPEQTVIKGKENFLKCSVVGFYPVEIDVSWLRDGQILPGTSTSKPQRFANGTFMINSTVPLIPMDSDASLNISCRVQHASLRGYLQKDIRLLFKEEKKGRSTAGVIVSLLVVMAIAAVLGWFLYERPAQKELKLCEIQGPETWTAAERVDLVCVGHHCPKGTEITWIKIHKENQTQIKDRVSSGHQDSEPLLKQEGYRVQTSKAPEGRGYCTITSTLHIIPSVEEHEGAVFRCNFHTKDQKTNAEEEVKVPKVQDCPGRLVLGDITGASLVNGDKVSLQCAVSGYFPAKLQVQWLKVEREGGPAELPANGGESDYEMHRTEEVLEDGKGYSCTASLTFTPLLYREQELEFICRVSHPSLESPLERSTGTLPVLAVPKPAEIEMVAPEKKPKKNTWLALEVKGFHPPDITIVWSCDHPDSGSWGLTSTKTIAKHSDGTYSSLSTCELSPEDMNNIGTSDVTATIQHESLKHPLQKTIRLGKKGRLPVLDAITIPRLVHGVEDSLQCKVSGYLPEDLHVEWLKVTRGSDVAARLPDGENGYRILQTEPGRETGGSCSFTSSLTFTPSILRDQDSKFICRVSHRILDMMLEKRTGKVAVLAVPKLEKIEVNESKKQKNPILTLSVSHFYPKEIRIRWSCDPSSAALWKQPGEVMGVNSSEGTYTVTSSYELSKRDIKKLGTVSITARVNHPSLRDASQVSLQLVTKGDAWELVSGTPGWDSTGAALIHTQQD